MSTNSETTYNLCIHCGQKLPNSGGSDFCCSGCETAYHALKEMRQADSTPPTEPSLVEIDFSTPKETTRTVENNDAAADEELFEEMDNPVFQQKYVTKRPDGMLQATLILHGMHCATCVMLIEKLVRINAGVFSSRANLARGTGTFLWNPQKTTLAKIARDLKALGYHAYPLKVDPGQRESMLQVRREMIQLGIAGVCAGNTMLIAIAIYAGMFSGMEEKHLSLFRGVSAVLGLVAVLIPGQVFFRNAWNAVLTRTPHMDLPVAFGLGIGTVDGIYRTFWGTGETYFDSLASLVFLLLVGRYMHSYQKRKTMDQVALLRSLTPMAARVVNSQGTKMVPVDALGVGDVVEVRPGETIPGDGTITTGNSAVDQSLLTGESLPISQSEGDQVIGGTTNLNSPLLIKIEATGYESRLGKLVTLMDEAAVHKTPLVQFADRIGGWFITIVIILGLLNMALWWQTGISKAVEQTVALLIVSCPCALGLATPLVIAVFQGRAAKHGILVKSGDAVERLAGNGIIWFDKTGTLTEGKLAIRDWWGDEEIKPVVACLEQQVNHPVARALAHNLRAIEHPHEIILTDINTVQGKGVRACFADGLITIGSISWFEELKIEIPRDAMAYFEKQANSGFTTILISLDTQCIAMATLGDTVREEIPQVLSTLETQGWRTGLLSGDHENVARSVGERLGITSVNILGGKTPEEKLAVVNQKELNENVVMVGDGVNDSAALSAADVGIAVHGGAEASLHAADIYFTQPDMGLLTQLITSSRRAMNRIYLNFGLSIGYNVFAVILAMMGLIHPLLAAVLMPISSLTVLSVALAGGLFKPG